MPHVTLEKSALAKLAHLTELVEVRDESGRVVGYFEPVANGKQEAYYEPPITREEIERRIQEPGGRSLAEILADLRSKS